MGCGLDIMDDDDNEGAADTSSTNAPPKHLIPAYAQIYLKDTITGYPIEMAYVRDQNGTLLGFDYFSREKRDGLETATMSFFMTPDTKSVTAHGLYRKVEEEKKEKEEPTSNESVTTMDSEGQSTDNSTP